MKFYKKLCLNPLNFDNPPKISKFRQINCASWNEKKLYRLAKGLKTAKTEFPVLTERTNKFSNADAFSHVVMRRKWGERPEE